MDLNLALVALIFWVGLSLAVAAYLDGRQHASRGIAVMRPRHHVVRVRLRDDRYR